MKNIRNRKDAYRCRDISGMNQILIDLKPKRSLGELYINQKIDVTKLVEFMQKEKKLNKDITYFHAFATAIGKVLYNRPLLNRFIVNRHTFEHKEITLSFVMKIDLVDNKEEVMVIIPISPNDNIYTLSNKIKNKVQSIRNHQDKGSGANKAIQFLGKLPNIIRIPIIGLFKWCDKHDMLPLSLIKDNIYYSSMIISNIGTLNCDGIYHNVTDFGTCSGIITIGEIEEDKKKYYCELGITMDERIADGFYFIKSIHLLEYILNNPETLKGNADEKIDFS